jgi:2-desacetyl-2-hydroxyethyl bacteriochlorophyllide A dehydrogenase
MKALVYMGPGRMEFQEVPDPVAGPGEVVVRTLASAICGSDLHGFREASPRRIPPLVMGHETVGVIEEAGPEVEPGVVGQRVVIEPIVGCGTCAWCRQGAINRCRTGLLIGRDLPGGFAERMVVPVGSVATLPDPLGTEAAVLIEPFANAVHVVATAPAADATVLVIGAGPIGVLMACAAMLDGARRVLVTDPVAERLARAARHGAVPISGDDLGSAIADATDGAGVDLVIDAAGFPATWALGIEAVRTGGRIVEVGLGAPRGELDYFAVLGKELTISGSYAWGKQDFARSLALIVEGRLDPTGWTTSMPLADGARAFERLVSEAPPFKVVLTP